MMLQRMEMKIEIHETLLNMLALFSPIYAYLCKEDNLKSVLINIPLLSLSKIFPWIGLLTSLKRNILDIN